MNDTAPTPNVPWYSKLLDNPKAAVRMLLFLAAFVGYDLSIPAQRAADAVKRADEANAKLEDAFKRLEDLEKLLKDVKVNQTKLLEAK